MTPIEQRLLAFLGADGLLASDARGRDAHEDVCHGQLGRPVAWVRPGTADEVSRVLALARDEKVAVVPVGLRTAYWRPLRFENAIVLDACRLNAVHDPDPVHRVAWCEAGASVRTIDDRLRAHGLALPCHPDATGDTSIGSMVATGFTSGIGMGTASIDDVIAGVELVLGTGERARLGAAAALGAPPFVRTGLPDPTGLLFASEGALGVLTQVAVRGRPRGHRGLVRVRLPEPPQGLLIALRIATQLRVPGLIETARAVDRGDPRRAEPVELDLVVHSPLGSDELAGRLRFVIDRIRAHAPSSTLEQIAESPDESRIPRFAGAPGQAWARTRAGRFAPVDVNLGYDACEEAIVLSERVLDEARKGPTLNLRRALYFAPDFVNFGLHLSLDATKTTDADARALMATGIEALSSLPIVPYRWGRIWGETLTPRLDPGYRACMLALKRCLDPDGILNPGVSFFDGVT